MKNKRVIVLAVAGVVLVGLAAIPFLINVDQFRPTVEAQLSSALGRKVTIGKLELSIKSGGVTANDIAIADDPAFSRGVFLQATAVKIGADLGPMVFSHSMNIRTMTLVEPQVMLLRGPGGTWNFSSLGSAARPEGPPRRAAAAANAANSAQQLNIQELTIEDGRITIASAASGNAAGGGRGGRNRGRNARGSSGGGDQENASSTSTMTVSHPSSYEHVNLTARNIGARSVMPFNLEAQAPGGGAMTVEGTAGPLNAENAAETPVKAEVTLKHVDIAATGMVDKSSGMGGMVDYAGHLESDGKLVRMAGKADTTGLRLVRGGAAARQPVSFDYATEYDPAQRRGTLSKGDIHMGRSVAHLTGNYENAASGMLVHMKMIGNSMSAQELQSVLPAFGVVLPPGASLSGGTVSTNLGLDGAIDRLVISGPLQVANAKLTGFDLGHKMSGLSALAGIHGGTETMIQSLNSKLRVAPEGIRADDLSVVIPGIGSLMGQGTIGANNALNFHMRAKISSGSLLGGMSALTSFGQSKGEVPFMIQGTTSNPIFIPDVAGAMANTMKGPVQGVGAVGGGIGGALGSIFGRKKQ